MTDKEMYELRIKNLEDQLRDSIRSKIEFREEEKKVAQHTIARMYLRLINEIDKAKNAPEAIESLLSYSKVLINKEAGYFFEDGEWWTIIDGKKTIVRL